MSPELRKYLKRTGSFIKITSKSSTYKHGIEVIPGIVDADYKGKIFVQLKYLKDSSWSVDLSLMINVPVAQMLICAGSWTRQMLHKFVNYNKTQSDRADGGEGATTKKMRINSLNFNDITRKDYMLL